MKKEVIVAKVIERAKVACHGAGYDPQDHFLDVRKMVDLGSGATRALDDIALTRYACYLIAQSGDPSKDAMPLRKPTLPFRRASRSWSSSAW